MNTREETRTMLTDHKIKRVRSSDTEVEIREEIKEVRILRDEDSIGKKMHILVPSLH